MITTTDGFGLKKYKLVIGDGPFYCPITIYSNNGHFITAEEAAKFYSPDKGCIVQLLGEEYTIPRKFRVSIEMIKSYVANEEF